MPIESLLVTQGAGVYDPGPVFFSSIGDNFRLGKFVGSDGNWYNCVLTFPDAAGLGDGRFCFNKSANGVSAWTEVRVVTPADISITNDSGLYQSSVRFKNDIFYIALRAKVGAANNTIVLVRYNAVTDTLSFDTLTTAMSLNNSTVDVEIDSSNIATLLYGGTEENIGGTNYARARVVEFSSGTWGTPAEIPGQSGIAADFYVRQILCAASDRFHLLLHRYGVEIYHCSYFAGGTFGTLSATGILMTFASVVGPSYAIGLGMTYVDSGSVGRLMFPTTRYDSGTNTNFVCVARAADADSPTAWTLNDIDSISADDGGFFVPGVPVNSVAEQDKSLAFLGGDSVILYYILTRLVSGFITVSSNVRSSTWRGSTWGSPVIRRTDLLDPYVISAIWAVDSTFAFVLRIDATNFDNAHAPLASKLRHGYFELPAAGGGSYCRIGRGVVSVG